KFEVNFQAVFTIILSALLLVSLRPLAFASNFFFPLTYDKNVEEPEAGTTALIEESIEELPVLAVRETVIYPGALLPVTVGRPSSLALVQSLGESRLIAVISQLDPRVESPGPNDLYGVGTVCVMHKSIKVPRENLLLFCEGIARIRAVEFTATEPYLRARVERIVDVEPDITPEIEALRQNVISLFQQIVTASPNLSDELANNASSLAEPGRLADYVAGNLPALSHV